MTERERERERDNKSYKIISRWGGVVSALYGRGSLNIKIMVKHIA
jgi:hypothetical protein